LSDAAKKLKKCQSARGKILAQAGNENASKLVSEISGVVKAAVLDAGGNSSNQNQFLSGI